MTLSPKLQTSRATPKAGWWLHLAVLLWAMLLGSALGADRILSVQLDRTTIRLREPVLVSAITDGSVSEDDVQVQIRYGTNQPVDIIVVRGLWFIDRSQRKLSTILVSDFAQNRFVFREPGDYTIYVGTADSTASAHLTVSAASETEVAAFDALGAERFPLLFYEAVREEPYPELVSACQTVVTNFPSTVCARYCEGYLAMATFKNAFKTHRTQGGESVYFPIADELKRVLVFHEGSFFADQIRLFLAYALALAHRDSEALDVIQRINPDTGLSGLPDLANKLKREILEKQNPTPPSLSMLGDNPTFAECGRPYIDAGASASHATAGNLTAAIGVSNGVNPAVIGTYTVTYRVGGPNGDTVIATRTVNVVDTRPPIITLVGNNPLEVGCSLPFDDPGARASDACAGDLTASLEVAGAVDPNVLGSYTLTYAAVDPTGNTGTAVRIVNVVNTTAPVVKPMEPPAGAPQTSTGYAITDLGTLPGQSYSYGRAINASGQVVGGSGNRAFVWDAASGMQDLGVEPATAPWGTAAAFAADINDSGMVVGGSGGPFGRAFLWDRINGSQWIGPADSFSSASGINNAGQVVGQFCTDRCRSFLYRNGTADTLPEFPNSFFTFYAALNDSGDLVGSAYVSGGTQKAFLYSGGNFTALPSLPGARYSSAAAINNLGQIVGQANLESGGGRAWLYSGGVLTDLGLLPGSAFPYSYATSINNLGHVVGGSGNRAFLYKDGAMTDVNSLLPENSGWEINYAADINDLGQIVGSGFHNGQYRGYVLLPVFQPPTVTCPGAITVQADATGHAGVPDVISDATAIGICPVTNTVNITQCPVAGTLVGPGTYTIQVAAKDACGNSGTCTVAFTVEGVAAQPPSVSCPPATTVAADGSCQAAVPDLTSAVAVSPAGSYSTTQSPASGTLVGLGTHPIIVTVKNAANVSSTCTNTFSVVDTTPPQISCPSNMTVACDVRLEVLVTFAVTATDACDSSPTVTCSPVSGSGFRVGTATVNCTARDASGNSTNCSFTVTRAALGFTGFLAPVGGADATGGSFANPIRTFKLGSKIPVKFTASCNGAAVDSGLHTLQVIKWSNETTAETPIDASPADAATTGNQFRLSEGQWIYILDTAATAMTKGTWELRATLSDGTTHSAFLALK